MGDWSAHRTQPGQLRVACFELPLFKSVSVEAVYQAIQALPLEINRLPHHTLTAAAAIAKQKTVTTEHVQALCDFCSLMNYTLWQQYEEILLKHMIRIDWESGDGSSRIHKQDHLELPLDDPIPF